MVKSNLEFKISISLDIIILGISTSIIFIFLEILQNFIDLSISAIHIGYLIVGIIIIFVCFAYLIMGILLKLFSWYEDLKVREFRIKLAFDLSITILCESFISLGLNIVECMINISLGKIFVLLILIALIVFFLYYLFFVIGASATYYR